MTGKHFYWAAALLGLLTLAGCATPAKKLTPANNAENPPELRFLPSDARREPLHIDTQLALANRGLYLNQFKDIKYIDQPSCLNLDLHSHRGHYQEPENSTFSILRAIENGFDAIEIDVMQLASGEWVLHHDEETGRATGRVDGVRMKVNRMKMKDWSTIGLRRPDTGEIMRVGATTLADALNVFSRFARNNQVLHVEIKGDRVSDVDQLDYILHSNLGHPGRYMYSSSNLSALKRLREVNAQVYLGFIRPAHPRSIELLKKQAQQLGKHDPLYESMNEQAASYERAARRYGRYTFDPSTLVKSVRRDLGSNAGIHLDIREYGTHPAITTKARAAGLRSVMTWTVNGQSYHFSEIEKHKKSSTLPTGVIIDDDVYGFCAQLVTLKNRNLHPTTSPLQNLPHDADLRKIDLQKDYVARGMYMKFNGSVSPLHQPQHVAKQKPVGISQPSRDSGDADEQKVTPVIIKLDQPRRDNDGI